MQTTATYREQGRVCLEQAFVGFESGDLSRASEQGWDAAAHMLKAVAVDRGWEHGDLRLLHGVMGKLANETRSDALLDGFSAASTLRTHLQEGLLERDWVAWNLGRVRAFVDAVDGLLEGS